jgi:hypothetical protein
MLQNPKIGTEYNGIARHVPKNSGYFDPAWAMSPCLFPFIRGCNG